MFCRLEEADRLGELDFEVWYGWWEELRKNRKRRVEAVW